MSVTAKEKQNQAQLDRYFAQGGVQLGPWTSHLWRDDPRHLGFLLARYKFCAKMLSGKRRVLEVGCGDAFGMRVVQQTVESICGIDLEPQVVADAQRRLAVEQQQGVTLKIHDMTESGLEEKFEAAYSLDVIEHIPKEREHRFMTHLCQSLIQHAVCIIGTPNITASAYASPFAAQGHINLKSAETLQTLLVPYFRHIFLFSMNDEVVHTGFYPMAHYLLAMGVELRV